MLLACPTWRLAQKCPERTTLKFPFLGLKGDRMHLRLAFLPMLDSNPQDAEREVSTPYQLSHPGRLGKKKNFQNLSCRLEDANKGPQDLNNNYFCEQSLKLRLQNLD